MSQLEQHTTFAPVGMVDAGRQPDASHDGLPDAARPTLACCPLCRSRRLHYAFSIGRPPAVAAAAAAAGLRVVRCDDCRLMLLNPQPSDAELAAIYGAGYFVGTGGAADAAAADAGRLKAATARRYLDLLAKYRGRAAADDGGSTATTAQAGRLLEVGCGRGELLAEAARAGYAVTGVELSEDAAAAAVLRLAGNPSAADWRVHCGSLEDADLPPGSFDACVLADVIEHARDPLDMLRRVRAALKPDGVLLVATPSLDSWSAKLLKRNWMEFKPEHLTYLDRNTLRNALFLAGFQDTVVTPGWKTLSLDYVAAHFERFPVPVVGRAVRGLRRVLPKRVRRRDVNVVASGMLTVARVNPAADAHPMHRRHTLSVVVPAFNEAATIAPLLDAVLAKQVPGMDLQIIVVESNSTDGTREVVRRYEDHPRVTVVLEDEPRGKGHAVRTGLARATGDFVLIQDADLEYDLEDYDVLLEPLAAGREALVLGSRHGGEAWWKMRQFERQPLLSAFLNLGHWVFTTLVNVLFRQQLKDPFTMYKVFRRDCLTGLDFKCNRFDFDYELLVKMVRVGYRPVEIPVNYRSRSFKEGKKVSTLRDPINWLRALAWLRVTTVDPMAGVARRAAAGTAAARTAAPDQVERLVRRAA
jgi:glycosyltransferase involved in cell wall biosynthesis/SAM-dependent methyltransferase